MMESRVVSTRIRVGSSAARQLAASRPNEKSGKIIERVVEYVKAFGRSNKTRAAWMHPAAEGATEAELIAMRKRSAEEQLMANRTAAFAAMYGSW